MCPIGLRIARARLRILLSPCPHPLEALTRSPHPGHCVPLPVRVTLLRRGRQHASHDRDESDGQPECLNWHGEEVEHRLSYLSVESRSREGDQHRPQSSCPAPMYGRPLGNPPSNWEVSDAHDFDAFIIGQRLPYRCFGNKRLTAHSAHRRQRELLRHLQHVHGVVTAAVSKIRCHGQRADENDSGEHRRNPRSGAWVRSDDTLAGEGRLLHSILVHWGNILDTKTILGFTFSGRWLPSTARGAVVVRRRPLQRHCTCATLQIGPSGLAEERWSPRPEYNAECSLPAGGAFDQPQ
jgi:hypothetical protein